MCKFMQLILYQCRQEHHVYTGSKVSKRQFCGWSFKYQLLE